ncbi:MAG: ATPase, T2SS/T4P/T4SS family [Patescibacteria group bacterium]
MSQFNEDRQNLKLYQIKAEEEEALTKIISEKYGIPYLDVFHMPINSDFIRILNEEDARNGELAVIQKIGRKLQIIVKNPEKAETKQVLEKISRMNYTYQLFIASHRGLEQVLKLYKTLKTLVGVSAGQITIAEEALERYKARIHNVSDIRNLLVETLQKSISEILEIIIAGALKIDASDIHIEPEEANVRIRYRLNGVLQDIISIEHKAFKFLIGRIKLISGLKLNVVERTQDGRFTIKLPTSEIEVRVSVLPGSYGENFVLRVLDPEKINLSLVDLGIRPETSEEIARQLERPSGMILAIGPTGSGKTTTLYTFLKILHTAEIKIITIEDPIEYHLPGIEQTQVNPSKDYTFALGLNSILRQDPDVILVGEIRDFETAETAIHAALTGHLVFSTLHTNDTAGTILRLVDMGIKPQIIVPAINMAISQRLMRKLCIHCKKPDAFNDHEIEMIKKELDSFPKKPRIEKPNIELKSVLIYRPGVCEQCDGTGYNGRVGVFEIVLFDETFEKLVLNNTTSESDMRKAIFAQGQITMKQDAVLRILEGITDISELKRVFG